ncbi:hypothetical protein BGW41_003150 [Actinomortierella wolfii]|nr:hypothetical protein BGW41_003150 [Actinomortierella wolfii]
MLLRHQISAIILAFAALLTLTITPSKAIPTGLISCLQNIRTSRSNAYLTLPSSSTYQTERYGFNLIFDFYPTAIYHPATDSDVAAAIQCATAFNVSIAPRSGGHSFEGYCGGGRNGSLVIDLSNFQQFSLDESTGIATVGAGTRLGPLYTRVWNAGGYLIPAGICPSVGVGGHALGGGVGMLARKYGLLTHNIVSVTFVDAQGGIHSNVDASSDPDLFWALRGAGGGNFGIVTEFRFRVYKAPPTVTSFVYQFPLAQFPTIIDAFMDFAKTATEDLTALMFPSPVGIDLKVAFLGPKNAALEATAPLIANVGSPPTNVSVDEASWIDTITTWVRLLDGTLEDYVASNNRYSRGRSLMYRKPLSDKEKDIVVQYMSNPPKGSSATYMIVDMLGGRLEHTEPPAVYDHHRGAWITLVPFAEWGTPDSPPGLTCPDCLVWSKNFAKELHDAYTSGPLEAYQNMIELELPLSAYYGEENLPRLQQIKKKIDPANLFSFPQSIPLP